MRLYMRKHFDVGKKQSFEFIWLNVRKETICATAGLSNNSGVKMVLNFRCPIQRIQDCL